MHWCVLYPPEVRTDGSEDISVTRECFAMVHFHDDVSQLSFVVQGFKLLEDVTSM